MLRKVHTHIGQGLEGAEQQQCERTLHTRCGSETHGHVHRDNPQVGQEHHGADVRATLAVGGDMLFVRAAMIPHEARCHGTEYQPVRGLQRTCVGQQEDQIGKMEDTEVQDKEVGDPALRLRGGLHRLVVDLEIVGAEVLESEHAPPAVIPDDDALQQERPHQQGWRPLQYDRNQYRSSVGRYQRPDALPGDHVVRARIRQTWKRSRPRCR